MTKVSSRLCRARLLVGVMIVVLTTLGAGTLAYAHTDFDSSDPIDGAVLDGVVSQVIVNFTKPAQPAGEGFELLDPAGAVRTPTSVDETDGTSFILTFDPPLAVGVYGLRWMVRAGDAHPIDGSFRFEVTGTTTTTVPSAVGSAAASTPPTTISPAAATSPSIDGLAQSTALDEFLNPVATAGDSAAVGRVGRTITILGMIFGVGVLAALLWTIRGRHDELDAQLAWIRLAGLVIITGGLIEFAALAGGVPTAAFGGLLSTKAGVATVLKTAGGLVVVLGFHRRAGRIIAPTMSLSAAVATDLIPDTAADTRHAQSSGEHRWTASSSAAFGLAGYALVLVSFWFDGHTVSEGPWAIHSLVNLVHIGAAAVWGGGVFAMTTIAWMRHRRSERVGLAAMVVRFSSTATWSLAAVIVAGFVMTWMILDSPGDLLGTQWGRLLVAKTAVVAVAAGLGGFNHFRLRPALEQRPDDPALARELRISLSVESAFFVAVVVLTAVLVASAT